MEIIVGEVKSAVENWKEIANKIGISKAEQEMMSPAFKY